MIEAKLEARINEAIEILSRQLFQLERRLSVLEDDYRKRQEDEKAVTNYLMDLHHDKEKFKD